MTPPDPTTRANDPFAAESYPTFWEAIPVDPIGETTRPLTLSGVPDDAYAEFLALAEDGRSARLTVEQSDVGLN